MRILHTSDWHLGQNFMGKSREEEHQAFLTWLLETIEKESIDVVIVAGDIFDTGSPPNYALELYYNFLTKLSNSSCRYVVITAGNHDSIATLKAPKELLKAMSVYVITSGDKDDNGVIEIYNEDELEAVICGVPFLRDSVVRKSKAAQTMNEKEFSLSEGIREYYDTIYEEAKEIVGDRSLPIIATGHLTTIGSKSSDSEREIYIGGTLDIDSEFLGRNFDYVALGHLHINQKVGSEHIRYSGSPIPLSFSEANSKKRVNIISFDGDSIIVEELEIPLHRPLLVIRGNLNSIIDELNSVEDSSTWIEIHLDDKNPFFANEEIRREASKLKLTILALKIDRSEQALRSKDLDVISLDELKPIDVFNRRLNQDAIEDKALQEVLNLEFKTIVNEVLNR